MQNIAARCSLEATAALKPTIPFRKPCAERNTGPWETLAAFSSRLRQPAQGCRHFLRLHGPRIVENLWCRLKPVYTNTLVTLATCFRYVQPRRHRRGSTFRRRSVAPATWAHGKWVKVHYAPTNGPIRESISVPARVPIKVPYTDSTKVVFGHHLGWGC